MTVDLPDEILDAIMADIGGHVPAYGPWDVQERKKAKKAWSACSLVCKRWSNIALPHLFRSIRLHFLTPPLELWIQFFANTSQIAKHVQVVHLGAYTLKIHVLSMILQTLQSLRRLDLEHVVIRDDIPDSPGPQLRYSGDHIIERLSFAEGGFCEPLVQCASVANLLSLFAEVGELYMKVDDTSESAEWPTEKHVDAFASTSPAGHPRIRKLRCGGECVGGFFIPSYLRRIGALDNLTHLTFHLLSGTKWESFLELVKATSSTLTSLCIEIGRFTEHGADHDIAVMKDALTTCNVLKEIKVVISLPYDTGLGRYIRHPDGKQICYPFKEHETNWLAAIRILALLPPKRLHSATVSLRGTSTDAHILAWHCVSANIFPPEKCEEDGT